MKTTIDFKELKPPERADKVKDVVKNIKSVLGAVKARKVFVSCGAMCCGTTARNMAKRLMKESRSLKDFIDKLGGIWMKSAAKNKVGGVFVSGGGFASGIELTQMSLYSTLLELGLVVVGYVNDMPGFGSGANQWGPFAQVGTEGKDGPREDSLTACFEYGKRLAWATKNIMK